MENSLTPAEALARLEEPFASKDVKWLVAATSRDGRKGRVAPYADPRAYTDRLNRIFTAGGWTREYSIHTVSPITRMKKDKPIQTGKVLVTCVVSIPGVGTHSGSGEEWADDENAMTSAEAQAFKRACSCFGLGRYFYNFAEMWVDLDEYKHPREIPALPSWALPECERRAPVQSGTARTETGNGTKPVEKSPLDANVTGKIEACRRDLGQMLYSNVLESVAKVRSARDIPNQRVQQEVLKWMESGVRGMAQVRRVAAEIAETEFYGILDSLGIRRLNEIQNFGILAKLVERMNEAQSRRPAA
ncbi:MAG TPA: Rad52/Rad22 family DNA repair protein [Terriglobales bacterium]|nr:Rad52/Rad22 family DNA repair protein [Terriglobales bacterium]